MPNDDYIKRNDAINAIRSVPPGNWSRARYVDAVERVPAADVEPVVHGRWIPGKAVYSQYDNGYLIARYYDRWTCSVCNYVINDRHYSRISYKRCPECGARMDAEPPKGDEVDEHPGT